MEYSRPGPFVQSYHERIAARRVEYKPFALRWPFLGTLLVSLLALMGFLAYGLHALPQADIGDGVLRNAEDVARTRGLLPNATHLVTERALWTTTDDYFTTTETQTRTDTVTKSSGDFGVITATVTETITTTSSLLGVITISVTETMSSGPDTSLSISDAYGVTETIVSQTTPPRSSGGSMSAPDAFGDIATTISRTDISGSGTSVAVPGAFGVIGTSIIDTLTLFSPLTTATASDEFGITQIDSSETGTTGSATTSPIPSKPSDEFGVIATTVIESGTLVTIFRTMKGSSWDTGGSTTLDTTTTSFATSSDAYGKVDHSETVLVKTYITASVTTLTNAAGLPTSTSTIIPSAVSTPTTATLTDSLGQPTATIVTSDLSPPITTILTNGDGIATRTVVVYPIPTTPPAEPQVFYISTAHYFVGFCLPTLLSILVAIPIRALNMNAKLFQPWHELTQASGAPGRESLNLPTNGFISYANGLRALLHGKVVISLTTILMMCSVLLVPLSAETIVLQLRGNCVGGSAGGCTYQLVVSETPAKAAIALLALMCVLVILIFNFLWRWKSGVYTNPWSICGMAGLTQNRDVRALFVQGMKSRAPQRNGPDGTLKSKIADRRFKLDWFHNGGGKMEYGVMLWDRHSEVAPLYHDSHAAQEEESPAPHAKGANRLPFMLGLFGSLLFLSVLLGLLALIVYYNSTGDDTAFERFMDSQSFGTKFLFTSIGTVVTLFWSSFVGSESNESPVKCASDVNTNLHRRRRHISLPITFSKATGRQTFYPSLSTNERFEQHLIRYSSTPYTTCGGGDNCIALRVSHDIPLERALSRYADIPRLTHLRLRGYQHSFCHDAGSYCQLVREMALHAHRSEHHRRRHVLRVR